MSHLGHLPSEWPVLGGVRARAVLWICSWDIDREAGQMDVKLQGTAGLLLRGQRVVRDPEGKEWVSGALAGTESSTGWKERKGRAGRGHSSPPSPGRPGSGQLTMPGSPAPEPWPGHPPCIPHAWPHVLGVPL